MSRQSVKKEFDSFEATVVRMSLEPNSLKLGSHVRIA